jgi:CRP-like cAMP-binding protein
MASLLTLTQSQPVKTLGAGETLLVAGESPGGELFVLEQGSLLVERDGIELATITEPGALIGEMSVLLGIDHSATVRALAPTRVRVIDNAIAFLERTPLVAMHVATLACARLDATSALLVELKQETTGKAGEQSLLNRILNSLVEPAPKRRGWQAHE